MNPILTEDFKPILGTEEATIDDKGRILVSRKKRERLGDTLVIAEGRLKNLVAYPERIWDAMMSEIYTGPAIYYPREDFARMVMARAEDDIKFDAQNRFVLPYRLREYAKLKDKILLVGCGHCMEIWLPEEYAKWEAEREGYQSDRRDEFDRAHLRLTGRMTG